MIRITGSEGHGPIDEEAGEIRLRMMDAVQAMAQADIPTPTLKGKLLRPLVCRAGLAAEERDRNDPRFWAGALAIQMVHEASLLHDDIVDGADQRRGSASLAAHAGVAEALIAGDHLLTAAYRVALRTESAEFMERFVVAVERTVAGERLQGSQSGEWLDEAVYRDMMGLKSGELFGCALVLGATLRGECGAEAETAYALGRRVGTLYQMVDDFLDYCPHADVGKPPLQDYRHRKWTFPLLHSNVGSFDYLATTVPELLFTPSPGKKSAMRAAFEQLCAEADAIERAFSDLLSSGDILRSVLRSWIDLAEGALSREEQTYGRIATGSRIAEEARALGGFAEQAEHFQKHSKSFRFAARLFPPPARRVVGGIYAFCRFTDDLVDEREYATPAEGHATLDEWLALSRHAYAGDRTDIPFLDEVMGLTAERGVSFHYAESLIAAVRTDLEPSPYASMGDLRVYTHGVASVVGQWMTELFGTPSAWTLERAGAMGHAMQLTNIVRDVGEDWRMGRLYLPLDRMAAVGLSPETLGAMVEGDEDALAAHREGYRALLEEIMAEAESSYDAAFSAIPTLPPFFQRPVSVAASVYRGIHAEVRRNDHDNLRRRAFTSLPRKVALGASGLLALRRARRASRPEVRRAPEPLERGREVGA